jgi:hypothetical protein
MVANVGEILDVDDDEADEGSAFKQDFKSKSKKACVVKTTGR